VVAVERIKDTAFKKSSLSLTGERCIVCEFVQAGRIVAKAITGWLYGKRYTEYFVEEEGIKPLE